MRRLTHPAEELARTHVEGDAVEHQRCSASLAERGERHGAARRVGHWRPGVCRIFMEPYSVWMRAHSASSWKRQRPAPNALATSSVKRTACSMSDAGEAPVADPATGISDVSATPTTGASVTCAGSTTVFR